MVLTGVFKCLSHDVNRIASIRVPSWLPVRLEAFLRAARSAGFGHIVAPDPAPTAKQTHPSKLYPSAATIGSRQIGRTTRFTDCRADCRLYMWVRGLHAVGSTAHSPCG